MYRSQQPVDAIRGGFPHHPEWEGDRQVDEDLFPRGPSATRERLQIPPVPVNANPAVVEQGPVRQYADEVVLDYLAMLDELARGCASQTGFLGVKARECNPGNDCKITRKMDP